MIQLRALSLLLVLSCTTSPLREEKGSELEITVDGKPYEPSIKSLSGTPDRPAAGDVVWVAGYPLTLGREKAYRFRTTPITDGRLLLETADGASRVVSVSVNWRETETQERVFVNPLAKLSDEEVQALWGLTLSNWPEGTEEKLKHLDTRRAVLAVQSERGSLPAVPHNLRYLEINPDSGGSNKLDLSALGKMRDIQYLHLAGAGPVDCGILSTLQGLRYLQVISKRIDQLNELANLSELRQIGLHPQEECFDQIGFAASLVHLRRFTIGISQVRDLSPLSGLRDLAFVDAHWSPITSLPMGELPSLRTLRIMGTSVTDGDAQEFAKRHPECRVLHRFSRSVRERARGSDLIRIRQANPAAPEPLAGPPLIDETDLEQIRMVLDRLDIDEKNIGSHFCHGGVWLSFYRKNLEVLRIRFDHGLCLHWHEWPHDGWLTTGSSEFLCRWLDRRGVQEPLLEFEKGRR